MKKSKQLNVLVLSALTAANFLTLESTGMVAHVSAQEIVNGDTVSAGTEQTNLESDIKDLKMRLAALEEKEEKMNKKVIATEKNVNESKKIKTHVDGQFDTTMTMNSNETLKARGADRFNTFFRLHFRAGTPDDKMSFYSELNTVITPGKTDSNQGNYPNASMAVFHVKDLWGFDSVGLGRMSGDIVGIEGGILSAKGNCDGIELNKKIGAVNYKLWQGNFQAPSDDTGNDENTLTVLDTTYRPNKKTFLKMGAWWNSTATHNSSAGSTFNAPAGAGFDKQNGVVAGADWDLGKGNHFLVSGAYTNLSNPTGGLKEHPIGYALMYLHTQNARRPNVFVHAVGLCDEHHTGSSGWSIGFGSNDAGVAPKGMANCMGHSAGTMPNEYCIGDNVNVLSWRYEYVITDGLIGCVTIDHAWVKDKSLRSDLSSDALKGDNSIALELTAFF